jgi:DNA-binding transcriptional LysR family regulator
MHFTQRIRTVWPWLPAFRAVAETEHLPTAAHELGVVPSSLSRSIKLLEDELGIALFERASKALVLNAAGREILAVVRDAMRRLDDAIARATSDELRGHIVGVACADLAHALLAPACAELLVRAPQLRMATLVAADDAIPAMLVRGDADIALVLQPITHPDLECATLGSLSRSLYARELAVTGYVAIGTPAHPSDDGWPAGEPRDLVAYAHDERAALELCTRTSLATIAFDVVARSSGYDGQLVRLQTPVISPRTLHLVKRHSVGQHRRTDALVAAIRTTLPAAQ